MKRPALALIGFRAVGKSSVAKELAAQLRTRAIDLDEEVTKLTGTSPETLALMHGIEALRDAEYRVIEGLSQCLNPEPEPAVLAFGGGFADHMPSFTKALELKKEKKILFIYLKAPEDFLVSENLRLASQGQGRAGPWWSEADLCALFRTREPRYEELASHTISATNEAPTKTVETKRRSLAAISAEIRSWWNPDHR